MAFAKYEDAFGRGFHHRVIRGCKTMPGSGKWLQTQGSGGFDFSSFAGAGAGAGLQILPDAGAGFLPDF